MPSDNIAIDNVSKPPAAPTPSPPVRHPKIFCQPANIIAGSRHPRPHRRLPKSTNNWQFDREEFNKFNLLYGPFTLDACSDNLGHNAQVASRFYSPDNTFFKANISGETVWCHPPCDNAAAFIAHYMQCKADNPGTSTSGVFVLPAWSDAPWQPLIRHMQLVKTYAPGTMLFTQPKTPGHPEQVSAGPTRWHVHVFYDPPESPAHAALLEYTAQSACTSGQRMDNTPVNLPPTTTTSPPSPVIPLCSIASHDYGQRLLVFPGTVNGFPVKILIDSGAMRDFASSKLVKKFGLATSTLEHPLRVRLANGLVQATDRYLDNAILDIAEQHCVSRNFVITDIQDYDIILGKPWLTDINPDIDWTTNTITSPFHLQATSTLETKPSIHLVKAKRIIKTLRQRDSEGFYAVLQEIVDSKTPPADELAPTNTALSPANVPKLHDILNRHRDNFSPPTGLNNTVPLHRISLQPNATPPLQRTYRMSPAELQEVQRQLEDYLEKGWIRPSTSEFGAPILFVRKQDGSLRMCIDYRALNAITIKDRYPLPRIDELLDQLHGAKYFTSLDLWSGYHQVRVHPDDVHKTAFKTRYGHYEFLVLPFGLTNAPSSFMRLMNDILRDYLDKFVVVYLDDVLIYSKTEDDHLQHLDLVLNRLSSYNLHVKASKCKFAQASTTFLGFVVSSAGITVDPKKVAAVADWPLPHDLQSTRSFLGFTGFYRRFIKDYAKIASPLTTLTKTTTPFPLKLPQEAVDAFHLLKAALLQAPVLIIPFTGPDATFELYTDASGEGIGAVLLQDQGNGPQPACYESRKFRPAERNYAVHEQELLAVVHAVKKFRHYLEGCKHFTLYTDHHSLKFFFTQRDLSKRQARWSQDLAPFQPNMTIVYRPGKENQADALSRLFSIYEPTPIAIDFFSQLCDLLPADIILENTLQPDIAAAYAQDPMYNPDNPKRPKFLEKRDNLWYFKDRICVPQNPAIRQRILYEFHDIPTAGHPGYLKTLNAISQHFWWPRMTRTIKAYVSSCSTCQRIKPSTMSTPGLLQPHSVPHRPWSHVSTDLITDLPKSVCYDGNTYDAILTFVDMLTKQAIFVRTTKTVTSQQLAHIFLEHVYAKHGLPKTLVSDRDPRFNSTFWRSLFKTLGTQLNMSTSHHPQTDGQSERTHRTIEQILRAYVHPMHDDWSTWLPLAEFAYNNQYHRSTHASPFYANYGFNPSTPATLDIPTTHDASEYLQNLRDIHTTIARELELEKAIQTDQANRHRRDLQFNIGDQVRLSSEFITLYDQPSSKFRHRYLGPFTVIDIVSPVSYKLDLPASMSRVHPVFHVSRLLPWTPNPTEEFPTRQIPDQPIPAARDFVHGEAYEVDRIMDVKIAQDPESRARPKANSMFFLVKWSAPYSDPSHDSWEPYRNLKKLDAMKVFLRSPTYAAFTATAEFKEFAAKYKAKIPKVVSFAV